MSELKSENQPPRRRRSSSRHGGPVKSGPVHRPFAVRLDVDGPSYFTIEHLCELATRIREIASQIPVDRDLTYRFRGAADTSPSANQMWSGADEEAVGADLSGPGGAVQAEGDGMPSDKPELYLHIPKRGGGRPNLQPKVDGVAMEHHISQGPPTRVRSGGRKPGPQGASPVRGGSRVDGGDGSAPLPGTGLGAQTGPNPRQSHRKVSDPKDSGRARGVTESGTGHGRNPVVRRKGMR